MSVVPLSPIAEMTPIRTPSQDSSEGIRKRVCKACDRCRLKKSRCDGTSPCSRCRADNAICVFGERKKSHDKVYPKGYVEMLEQQQGQLVGALQETYHRLDAAQVWSGPALSEANGHPLTHDILAALNLLESKHDGSGDMEIFEDDCQKLQSRLLADGAGYVHRRGSFSSESNQSQHGPSRSSTHGTPMESKPPIFSEIFDFNSASSTPLIQSPMPRQRQSSPAAQSLPLQQTPTLSSDPQFYQAEWTIPDMSSPEAIMRSRFALQTPDFHHSLSDMENMMANGQFETPQTEYDATFGSLLMTSYPEPFPNAFTGSFQDFGSALDPMSLDAEFSRFIPVTT
ncbi:Fluconazole resistance protein 1 [Elasticomyces elasticus]|nr:Fluconazole resistance protein 1 [Elasticomyces elasticus]